MLRQRDGWHVYFTTADTAGRWSLGYTSFARWTEAGSAPQTFLDAPPDIGSRYAAATQIFSFAPQETCNVYRLGDGHLMLVEALATGSDWRRYFRAWTADSPGGTRKPLADTEANPCARSSNVAFEAGQPAWTRDFSHGEMIRPGVGQTLTIDPCRLQVLHQGMDPAFSGEYHRLPWRLALLTQTNPACCSAVRRPASRASQPKGPGRPATPHPTARRPLRSMPAAFLATLLPLLAATVLTACDQRPPPARTPVMPPVMPLVRRPCPPRPSSRSPASV